MLAIRVLMVGLAGGWLALAPAALAQAAPQCAPRTLDVSAVQAGSVTVSPLAGSRDASSSTQISFLGVSAHALRVISVRGSQTGLHTGRLIAYSQGVGASFVPRRRFAEGERVSVRALVAEAGSSRRLVDRFVISERDPITETPETFRAGNPHEIQVFHSRPDLRPSDLIVTTATGASAQGDIFTAPYGGPGQSGPMIVDGNGAMIWFEPLRVGSAAANLQVQTFLGRPVLTWWQGDISVHGFGLGEDVIADSTYTELGRVHAGNGYRADLHEFHLTPQGTALITAYAPLRCNLTAVGGSSDGGLVDSVMQEIDVRTGLVMFEWTSLDHVGLTESYEHPRSDSVSAPFDFFHINSIDLDADQSLLVSARNTWAVYELDPRTLQIRWRLGGKKSSFQLSPGTATAWQHDAREISEDEFSIFDNGASPGVHRQSRGIVVRLDPEHGTATLIEQLSHSPRLVADSQGNVQLLSNGDWFVGWGQEPYFSELTSTGAVVLDAHFPARAESYRDFRFPWTGAPSHRPAFALARGGATLYASWNGSTLAAAWSVLEGPSTHALAPVLQAPRTGFETAIALAPPARGSYIAVQALDASNNVLATSAIERVG
jgi:Arylsulfotransferase (ASST)